MSIEVARNFFCGVQSSTTDLADVVSGLYACTRLGSSNTRPVVSSVSRSVRRSSLRRDGYLQDRNPSFQLSTPYRVRHRQLNLIAGNSESWSLFS